MSLEDVVESLLKLSHSENGSRALRLPPERELGETLGMSRGALREQLSVLEQLGFLVRTQGRGTYLDLPGDEFVRSYFAISRRLGYFSDEQFAEARVMIEEAAAAGAARVATDQQIAELRADIDRMIAATRDGRHEDAFEADARFHTRISEIVDNPIFRFLDIGLSHVLRETIRYRRRRAIEADVVDEQGLRKTDTVHYRIVEAIQAHDPDEARDAMHEHFEDWLKLGFPHAH